MQKAGKRFYEVRDFIRKSLINIRVDLYFTQIEFDLISVLQPVRVAVETLCCEDANLLTSDVTLKFMLDELSRQNSELSNVLKDELIKRITERRCKYSDVLQFLHDPDEINNKDKYHIFNITSKTTIIKLIIETAEHLKIIKMNREVPNDNVSVQIDENVVLEQDTQLPISELTLKEKLHCLINQNVC